MPTHVMRGNHQEWCEASETEGILLIYEGRKISNINP